MSIADKARELREAFLEQYGVEVHIQIYAYDGAANNPQLNRETAEQLGMEIASVFNGPVETEHEKGGTSRWFSVGPPREERVNIVLFYPDEEVQHEQSN